MTFEVGHTYATADEKGATFLGSLPDGKLAFYSLSKDGHWYLYGALPNGHPIDGNRGKFLIIDKISEMFS